MPSENRSRLTIVEPHRTISREVEIKDLERVKSLYFSLQMFMEDLEKTGAFKDVFAIAHQQIETKDPLRFFVINNDNKLVVQENKIWDLPDYIIVNPVITKHTNNTVTKREGCLSYPGLANTPVERWNKIEVDFETIDFEGKKLEKHNIACSGKLAQIFQHEINHFDCNYIYKIK